MRGAAAVLAEIRPEPEPLRLPVAGAAEHAAREIDRLVLELAAADRAVEGVDRDDHLRARLARGRALAGGHGDRHRILAPLAQEASAVAGTRVVLVDDVL